MAMDNDRRLNRHLNRVGARESNQVDHIYLAQTQ